MSYQDCRQTYYYQGHYHYVTCLVQSLLFLRLVKIIANVEQLERKHTKHCISRVSCQYLTIPVFVAFPLEKSTVNITSQNVWHCTSTCPTLWTFVTQNDRRWIFWRDCEIYAACRYHIPKAQNVEYNHSVASFLKIMGFGWISYSVEIRTASVCFHLSS